MINEELAAAFDEIAVLIELREDNPFRARAYANAARTIRSLSVDIDAMEADGSIASVKGLGKELRGHISEYLSSGKITLKDTLVAAIEPGLIEMLRINGLGPKRIRAIYEALQITSISELAGACRDGKVAALAGFGSKSAANILKNIEFLQEQQAYFRLDIAAAALHAVIDELKQHPLIKMISAAGSVRRRKEIAHDLDAVAAVAKEDDRAAVMEAFTHVSAAKEILANGLTKSTILLYSGIKMDLRVVTEDTYSVALLHFTGSKESNVALRGLAGKMGLKINEYGVWRGEERLDITDEAGVYATLGLDYIEPELREDRGEFDAAENHTLPNLVTKTDLKGPLHCHTNWSDGAASLEEMAEGARVLGYSYIGICDHSQAAAYAHGLTPADVARQHKEIDALNRKYGAEFHIFKGTECDILKDGTLDFDNDTLAAFDFVVASIHSAFQQSEEEQTQRILRALSNPYVTILGHLTGRLLLQREGYSVDIPAIIAAAGKRGVAIEINANPLRLDLDWRWHKIAAQQGVYLPICPDAHTTAGIKDMAYGVGAARKGWLETKHIPNTWETDTLRQWFQKTRSSR